MAAASALPGDRGDVEVCLGRSQTDPVRRPVCGGRFADQGCELGAFDSAQVVDDPLGIRLLRPRGLEVLAFEMGNDYAPSLEDLCILERARDELQLGEATFSYTPWNTRWTSAPASTSSAARRSALAVVFAYWKRPVSVTTAM